jgi:hypothetical protein
MIARVNQASQQRAEPEARRSGPAPSSALIALLVVLDGLDTRRPYATLAKRNVGGLRHTHPTCPSAMSAVRFSDTVDAISCAP